MEKTKYAREHQQRQDREQAKREAQQLADEQEKQRQLEEIRMDSSLTKGQKYYRLRKVQNRRSEQEKADLEQKIQNQIDQDMRKSVAALGTACLEDDVAFFQTHRPRETRLPRNKVLVRNGSSLVKVPVMEDQEDLEND